ncbi:VOC family protein [Cognatiyoonia sediminum]|uniref:VOC family protein n=1 Tax=Cognatiyoonia sediminum TaxID=1508389 RepID=UPI000A48EFBE|nr:VOC family protein [Cognatiyoonia sediminum]
MAYGHFVWTDLSTYDMAAARSDYSKIFGWSFSGDAAYDFALVGDDTAAAIFPMPDFLAKIDMPSFWMSYVHVADLDASVEKARGHSDVIIEVEPQSFGDDARVALVRDPSGAGFTLYEGPEITAVSGAGSVVDRYHHVSDFKLVSAFYEDMFGWTTLETTGSDWPVYELVHPDGKVIAHIEEVPSSIRGKFSYWMPCFSVASSDHSLAQITSTEGTIFSAIGQGRVMVADQQGAHFLIREDASEDEQPRVSTGTTPWKALFGVLCVWLAVAFEFQVFGASFS